MRGRSFPWEEGKCIGLKNDAAGITTPGTSAVLVPATNCVAWEKSLAASSGFLGMLGGQDRLAIRLCHTNAPPLPVLLEQGDHQLLSGTGTIVPPELATCAYQNAQSASRIASRSQTPAERRFLREACFRSPSTFLERAMAASAGSVLRRAAPRPCGSSRTAG